MTDFFTTVRVRDEPERWDALAERVSAASRAPHAGVSGFAWLALARTGWVAASVVVAAALMLVAIAAPDRVPAPDTNDGDWVASLAPTDHIGMDLVQRQGPPSVATLLLRARQK